MPLTPLAPAARREGANPRWSVAASTALHLVAIALVIGIAARREPPLGASPPSYDLVFETPPAAPDQTKPPGLPPIQPADIPVPPDAPMGTPAPAPMAPPVPDGAPVPQPASTAAPAAAAAPPPEPADTAPPMPTPAKPPTAATPAPANAAPPRLAFAPPAEPAVTPEPAPVEVQPNPTPPEVNLRVPSEQAAPPLPLDTTPIMPQPPKPLPPAPRPRPRIPQREALGTLANPMDLSLGPAAPRPAARGSIASRAIDLSPPLEREDPSRSDPYSQIRAANASADWNRGLLQYWLRHRFYPSQAAANGEQGTVTIQLTVNRSGLVEDVEVLSRSGSQWLDMAAVATWRGAHLRPFTNEMRQNSLTFPIPITYYLVRR